MRKSLKLTAFSVAAVGSLAITFAAPAATPPDLGGEPAAAPPGHPGLHGSVGQVSIPPGAKVLESGKANPNMTEQECTGLGGEVHVYSFCASGSVCVTSTEDGSQHFVCLAKSAQ